MVPGGGVILPGMIVEIDVTVDFFWLVGGGRWLRQNKASSCIFVVSCNLVLSVFEANIWADRIIENTSDASVSPHPSSTFQCRTS